MKRPRAHLVSSAIGDSEFSPCGLHRMPGVTTDFIMLPPAQLVWVPVEYQCQRCHKDLAHHHPGHGDTPDYETSDTHSATPMMRTTVECLLVELYRLHVAALAIPHDVRGCYLEQCSLDRVVCWCGRISWLDAQVWLAALPDPVSVVRERFRRHSLAKFQREQARREWRTQPFNPPRRRV